MAKRLFLLCAITGRDRKNIRLCWANHQALAGRSWVVEVWVKWNGLANGKTKALRGECQIKERRGVEVWFIGQLRVRMMEKRNIRHNYRPR